MKSIGFLAGLLFLVGAAGVWAEEPIVLTAPPAVGSKAPDFELESLAGEKVNLLGQLKQGQVVLVVLRGYPGYQCPLCTRQVGELIAQAESLTQGAHVLLIYPGPPDQLKKRAAEFIGNKQIPKNFHMLLDPDYKFTLAYKLRWDAPKETAYPSTFVIGQDQIVKFAKVSRTHGDRSKTAEVIAALGK